MTEVQTLSDLVADRARRIRQQQVLSTRVLAERCAALGAPHITPDVLMNIETGRRDAEGRRRREVSVDELVVLAAALTVSPAVLLLPELENEIVPVTNLVRPTAREAYRWLTAEIAPPLGNDGGPREAAEQIAMAYRQAWMRVPDERISDLIDRQLNERLADKSIKKLVRQVMQEESDDEHEGG